RAARFSKSSRIGDAIVCAQARACNFIVAGGDREPPVDCTTSELLLSWIAGSTLALKKSKLAGLSAASRTIAGGSPMKSQLPFCLLATITIVAGPVARAATEIRVACYSDGNECEATQALVPKFERDHPDVKVIIDKQAYKAILESLPVQLAAGQGPDIARTTDFGIISRYFLDLRPLIKDA